MLACHGKDHPFRNVDRVISDALQIFVDHQQIKSVFAAVWICRDVPNQHLFYPVKALIHNVIMGNHQLGPDSIFLDVGIYAFRDHLDDLRRHFPDMAHIP